MILSFMFFVMIFVMMAALVKALVLMIGVSSKLVVVSVVGKSLALLSPWILVMFIVLLFNRKEKP